MRVWHFFLPVGESANTAADPERTEESNCQTDDEYLNVYLLLCLPCFWFTLLLVIGGTLGPTLDPFLRHDCAALRSG